ncbi:MAG: hypothetical protein AUK54_04340 [Helicobacteraceae bacterium CG2_30_36_10]|nr:MAG: hypothetical protein AUK54_04340 [Helicobacteraceae bacterium CG2_30_36_10]
MQSVFPHAKEFPHAKPFPHAKSAFTLIEVLVSVMIISVVIMALIKMNANNTHIFSSLKQQTKTNQYASFLIANEEYGFENKSVLINDLLSEFDLQNDLRRELKNIKAEIIYQELQLIDMSEEDSTLETAEDTEVTSNIILEIGKSILKTDESSTALLRIGIQ